MMVRFLAVLVTPILLAGCPLDIGRCNYESRLLTFHTSLTGIVHGAPDSGAATLTLSEASGSRTIRTLTVGVQAWLAGAISDVRLLRTAERGQSVVFLVIPGFGASDGWSGYLDLESSRPSALEFLILEGGEGLDIEVTIGTAPGGTLRGTLHLLEDTGWDRPYCD